MKIITVSGTRPDFIRLIPTIRKLDKYYDHKLVWAGQNFDESLSTQFFKEFNREPDIKINNINKSIGIEYISNTIKELEKIYKKEDPDVVLVLGDTNASFSAIMVAKKMGITIYHIEAGNRCFDTKRVPEEINRYMIDSISDWHLTYTQRSREHLLLEGKKPNRVIVVGNPIFEIIKELIDAKKIKNKDCELYYLATIHRRENMDENRLLRILSKFGKLKIKIKLSNHPTLASNIKKLNYNLPSNIELFTPSNFIDFLNLENNAQCIITDSGTVPEEATILNKPCVLLRYSTERPELLENNSMIVCTHPRNLLKAIEIVIDENNKSNLPINEYHNQVSGNILKILMRYEK